MTWITPLVVSMSVVTMLASLIMALPSMTEKVTGAPCSVSALRPSVTLSAITLPDSTW